MAESKTGKRYEVADVATETSKMVYDNEKKDYVDSLTLLVEIKNELSIIRKMVE